MKGICTVLALVIELTPSEVTAFTSLHRSNAEPGLCKSTHCSGRTYLQSMYFLMIFEDSQTISHAFLFTLETISFTHKKYSF